MKMSKKMKAMVLGLCIAVPLSVWALGPHEVQSAKADTVSDTKNTITVSGIGKVYTASDEAILTLGVTTIQKTASLAMSENSKAMTKVLAALKTKGFTDGEIKTGNVSLYPQQNYKEGQAPQILAYTANNQVIIRTKKLDKIGPAIDAGTAAGATDITQLTFQLSENSAAKNSALKNAVKDAKNKAETLAGEVGATLGKAVIVKEVDNPDYGVMYSNTKALMDNSGAGAGAPTPIMAQDVEVTSNVQIMYEIK
jgi:uncharacterized protein YggE